MGQQYIVKPEELTVEGFAPYGEAIPLPETPAPKKGVDWNCWTNIASLTDGPNALGIVETKPPSGLITTMEAHTAREFLSPSDKPIIQAVALPADLPAKLNDPDTQPQAETVKAFIIRPGQSIILAVGTWHWAAIPLGREAAWYYFITNPNCKSPGTPGNPWIPFKNADTIQLEL